MVDAASILFPNDVPTKPVEAPGWVQVQRDGAEQRLTGKHTPSDAKPSAGEKDVADTLFPTDANRADVDYDRVVGGGIDQVRLDAIKDGDAERADALQVATASLTEDFRKAGTDPTDIDQAFRLVRQSASITEMTAEQYEQSFSDGMVAVAAAGISDTELSAARRLVSDLELVAPGTIASLEQWGAGNSIDMVKLAVKEAKRRGYR